MTCDERTPAEQIRDELDAIAGDLSMFLVDEGVRYVHTQTADAYAGRTETWPAAAGTFSCVMTDRSTPEPVNLGERLEQSTANIILKVPTDITLAVRDRVLVNDVTMLEVLTKQDVGTLSFLHTYGCVQVFP